MGKGDARKHILVVNDEPAILHLFRDLLGDEGYRVSLDKFERAIEELRETVIELQPDLVILDFIIGGEHKGWQLLQVLKMDRATREIPIIVCTAAAKQITELTSHLNELGVHAVLKPFDIDHLLDIIGKVWESGKSHAPSLDAVDTDDQV